MAEIKTVNQGWVKLNLPKKESNSKVRTKKPDWIRVKLPIGKKYTQLRSTVEKNNLHTICVSGNCPNMGECWTEGTATFMILGNICTRSCGFCNVQTGSPLPADTLEPFKVARSINIMGVKHAVITSVDRDDLKDGGSIIWAETVNAVRDLNPKTTIETLIPDFKGETENIDRIIEVAPGVVSHNLETVRRLTREVRIQAKYDRSLEVLKYLKENGINRTKSGVMLGLGETKEEVLETMKDLRNVGVDIITLGQYLQPTKKHLTVKDFIRPEDFKEYEVIGKEMGFRHVESGPLVKMAKESEIWLDGGHNQAAGIAISNALEQLPRGHTNILICGMLKTKDLKAFLNPLFNSAKFLYGIRIQGEENSNSAETIVNQAREIGFSAFKTQKVSDAILQIIKAHPNSRIIICGSLFLAGKILQDNA